MCSLMCNIYICTEMAPSLEWKGQKQKSKHNGVPISRGKNTYRLRRCESIRTPYRTMHSNEAAGGFAGGLYEACSRQAQERSSKRARSEEICLKVKWPSSPKCVCRKIRSVQAVAIACDPLMPKVRRHGICVGNQDCLCFVDASQPCNKEAQSQDFLRVAICTWSIHWNFL